MSPLFSRPDALPQPHPVTDHVRVTVNPPGPHSPAGLIASGLIGTQPWNLSVESPTSDNCVFTGTGLSFYACQDGYSGQPSVADPITFEGAGGGTAVNPTFVSFGAVWKGVVSARVELSDGTINLDHDRKLELIESLAKEFTVLSEVGSKDDTRIMAPFRWVEQIESELEAGAWKVIAEARESGSVGIFRHDGEVRQGLVDEILHAIDGSKILFEAPRKEQQVWFVRRLGPDVNLGNIAPEEVLSLETVRVGLRADTAVAVPEDADPSR